MKRDLIFIVEKLVSVIDETQVEILARQHGLRQKRDDGGMLSRLLMESSILLAALRGNPASILKDAASAYKVDSDAIAAKVRQEFAAKEKAKKTPQPATRVAKKVA
jgi:ParB family chromosome partitioning protein